MPWLRIGDTAANHPTALAVLESPDIDERLVNETFGFVIRCAAQSTAHLTDYVINRGTALSIAGFSRAEALIGAALYAGYMVEEEREIDGETRTVYKIMDDPEFIHMRTREEIEWERQRKNDNSNPALIVPVRLRDGDACRYCGLVVNFRARKGRLAGTYDHRTPGKEATLDTYVVACGACNAGRSNDPAADTAYPLLPAPSKPYYSPATIEWFQSNDWARRNGYKAPKPPARAIEPGQPSGNGTTGRKKPIQSNGPSGSESNGTSGSNSVGNGTTGQQNTTTGNGKHHPARQAQPRNRATQKASQSLSGRNPQIPVGPAEREYAGSGFPGTGSGQDGTVTGRVGSPGDHPPALPPPPRPAAQPRRSRPRGRKRKP